MTAYNYATKFVFSQPYTEIRDKLEKYFEEYSEQYRAIRANKWGAVRMRFKLYDGSEDSGIVEVWTKSKLEEDQIEKGLTEIGVKINVTINRELRNKYGEDFYIKAVSPNYLETEVHV